MSTIKPGFPRRKDKIFLVLILSLFLLLFLSVPPVLEGLFIISGQASQVVSSVFNVNAVPPEYSSVSQSASVIESGAQIILSAYWSGNSPLDYAWLATNETGAWENKTGIYGSPIEISGFSGWSNFTWSSPSFSGTVYWEICANETSGKTNCTTAMGFQVVPGAPTPPGGQGGGGGGAAPQKIANFTLDREFLKASLKQGETVLEHLGISNTGETALNFSLAAENMNKSIMLSEDSFILGPGEAKTITVAFTAKDDLLPEIYTGRLLASAGGITKSVMLIMEVKPRRSLFDLYVSLPEMPLVVARGEEVEADILMYNFGDIRPIDVTLYYSLRDFGGRDIIYSHETITIEEQRIVKRKVRIPEDLEYGLYLFYARIGYSNQTATSSGLIKVAEKKEIREAEPYISYWITAGLVAVAIISLLILGFWRMHATAGRKLGTREKPPVGLNEIKIESLRMALRLGSMEGGAGKMESDLERIRSELNALSKGRHFEKEVIARKGAEKAIEISFRNEGEGATAALSIEGLPAGWCSVSPKSAYAGKGTNARFRVRFRIPRDAKGVYPFVYSVKMGGHPIMEAASLVVAETERDMLSKELERISSKVAQMEKYYS